MILVLTDLIQKIESIILTLYESKLLSNKKPIT